MSTFTNLPKSTQLLVQDIANGQITPFIGAGVSIAATNNHPCASWVGLIWNALEYCQKKSLINPNEHQSIEKDLNTKPAETFKLVNCAERLSKILGYEEDARFQRWLNEAISSLPLSQTELLRNIAKLSPVNATTNYDLLIEATAKSRPIDLNNIEEARSVLLGQGRRTIHIHGHIKSIHNVVFSSRSYDKHTSNARHEFVQKTFSFTNSLLFIGCGNGLEDPNVGPWMQWDDEMFSNLNSKHYRLVLESELENAENSESRIINIAYGEKHSDLGPFIGQLVKAADEITQPSNRYAIHRGIATSSNIDVVDVVPPQESGSRSLELLGDNAANKSDFIAAIEYYEQSLAVAYDIWLELKICQAQIELGEATEAISKLLALKKEHGSRLSISLNLLSAYSKIPDYHAMIPLAQSVLKKAPKLPFVWDALFIAYQGLKRYSNILKIRRLPLILFPYSAPINERVGLAFFQTGRCLEALKCYEIVLNEKSENRTALLGKLRTLTHLGGKYFGGQRELSKAAYLNQALTLSEQLRMIDGQNPEVWIQRSIIQKEQEDFKNAKRSLEQAKRYGADTARALKIEATLLIRKKRFPAAFALLSKGIADYPNEPQMTYSFAIARLQKFRQSGKKKISPKEFEKIEGYFNSAIKIDPENVLFLRQFIVFYHSFGRTDKAEFYHRQLSRMNNAVDVS